MDSTFSRRTFLALVAKPTAHGSPVKRQHYGMVLDLARCFGCESCTLACRSALPVQGLWRTTIAVKERGTRCTFTPQLCQQCATPACLSACAFGALTKDADGIVRVVAAACTGCGACVDACPYQAIHVAATATGGQRAYKCELCTDATDAPQRTPPCVAACASGARIFGDFLHPNAAVARALAKKPQSISGPAQSTSILYLLLPGGAHAR